MTDLLPCPFCGGKARIVEGEESAYVQCINVKMHRAMFFDGDNDAANTVAEEWNRRAALPPAQPVAPQMRPETESEHIARDMREGRFPARSEPQMVAEDWQCAGCGSPPPFACNCVTDLAHVSGQNKVELKSVINPAPDAVEALVKAAVEQDGPATIYLTEVDYEDSDFPLVWASAGADSGGVPYHSDQAMRALVEGAAQGAREVFVASCDHTKQAIDYMEQVALAAIRAGGKP